MAHGVPMLILANETDPAASNIRDHLLSIWDHTTIGEFEGFPIFRGSNGKVTLASLPSSALDIDNPDLRIFPDGPRAHVIMYLSRHQSVSGNKTLTVHPIGNFSEAKFGGKEGTLVPTSPHLMSQALRILAGKPVEGYECTFEATHHGPYNDVPTFFIEIGSTLEAWNDPEAVRGLAETARELIDIYEGDEGSGGGEAGAERRGRKQVMEEAETERRSRIERGEEGKGAGGGGGVPKGPVCIGLGGGHYAPRHTKFALKEGLDFGHIIPSYAGKHLNTELAREVIRKTPGVERICAHGKKHRKEERIFRELAEEFDLDIVEY